MYCDRVKDQKESDTPETSPGELEVRLWKQIELRAGPALAGLAIRRTGATVSVRSLTRTRNGRQHVEDACVDVMSAFPNVSLELIVRVCNE